MTDPSLYDMTVPNRHRWARSVLLNAWPRIFSLPPTLTVLQTMHAQGAHEGWFGFASQPDGWKGSNNWGACDYLDGDEDKIPGCVGYFESTDHDVNGNEIHVRFRAYETPEDGCADFLRVALIERNGQDVVSTGNLTTYADKLRANHYFVAPADLYASALWAFIPQIAQALNEPVAVSLDADIPFLDRAIDWVESLYMRMANVFTS